MTIKSDSRLALGDILRPLDDFFQKLESDNGPTWLNNFKRFLRKEIPTNFTVWRRIKLGGLETAKAIEECFRQKDIEIGPSAGDMFKHLYLRSVGETIDLTVVRVEEVGCDHKSSYPEVCRQAFKWGLKLCPAEAGPQLRLQYLDQPKGESLIMATEPVETYGHHRLFSVEHVGLALSLSGRPHPGGLFDREHLFVFQCWLMHPRLSGDSRGFFYATI